MHLSLRLGFLLPPFEVSTSCVSQIDIQKAIASDTNTPCVPNLDLIYLSGAVETAFRGF
jgi:hypothetical protein